MIRFPLHGRRVIVRLSHEGSEYVYGHVVVEGFTFEVKVKPHDYGICNEFEALLHLADNSFSISHCHDESSFLSEEGQSISFRVLKMDFDEASQIPCDRVDACIYWVRVCGA